MLEIKAPCTCILAVNQLITMQHYAGIINHLLCLSIAPGITELFNVSIQTGTIPEAWKISSIVPLPKGSKHTNVSNYRPISLLPVLSKLLERHIYGLISDHLDENYPIALEQWDFQPKKSTVSALLDVVRQLVSGH